MYLLDTNIWLENILEQEKHEEVKDFLRSTEESLLNISEFSFFSIGLHLCYRNKKDDFMKFVNDLFIEGSVNLITLMPSDMQHLIDNSRKFDLDFDDSFQYTLAKMNDLTIISYDSDFDKTDINRKTPIQITA